MQRALDSQGKWVNIGSVGHFGNPQHNLARLNSGRRSDFCKIYRNIFALFKHGRARNSGCLSSRPGQRSATLRPNRDPGIKTLRSIERLPL